jgi:hypothetical protein
VFGGWAGLVNRCSNRQIGLKNLKTFDYAERLENSRMLKFERPDFIREQLPKFERREFLRSVGLASSGWALGSCTSSNYGDDLYRLQLASAGKDVMWMPSSRAISMAMLKAAKTRSLRSCL